MDERLKLSPKSLAIIEVMRKQPHGVQINISRKGFSIAGGVGFTVRAAGWPADGVVAEWADKLLAKAEHLRSYSLPDVREAWVEIAADITAVLEGH